MVFWRMILCLLVAVVTGVAVAWWSMIAGHGSILRIFGAAGELIESQRREAVIPLKGAVGGPEGPAAT